MSDDQPKLSLRGEFLRAERMLQRARAAEAELAALHAVHADLESVIAELKSLLRRACEADAHEDCHFDHNGGCQAHGFLSEPCPYPFIRQYLADGSEVAW